MSKTTNIILLRSINHLGRSGDVVEVSPGYARNYLVPQGLGLRATKENMKVLEAQRAELEAIDAEKKKAATELVKKLESVVIEIKVETNDEDQLFGSVGVADVHKVFHNAGIELNKRDIILPSGTVDQLGVYPVEVICHIDVIAKLEMKVVKA